MSIRSITIKGYSEEYIFEICEIEKALLEVNCVFVFGNSKYPVEPKFERKNLMWYSPNLKESLQLEKFKNYIKENNVSHIALFKTNDINEAKNIYHDIKTISD